MTPFEAAGYTKEQLFKVVIESTFVEGTLLQLDVDDGSKNPFFKLIKKVEGAPSWSEKEGGYVTLKFLAPYSPEGQLKETKEESTVKTTSNKGYTFKTGKNNPIDFLRISYEMGSEEDMMIVYSGKDKYVVFSQRIVRKAKLLGLSEADELTLYELIENNRDLSVAKAHVIAVKEAPWGKHRPPQKREVVVTKVST